MRKQALDRQVRDAKQATDRHARDLRSMLRRQADDARRSIDQAKRSSRTGDSGSGAQAGAGGSWGSLFGSGDGTSSQSLDDALMVWALPVAAIAALPLAVGHLAALVTTGSWPRYHLRDAPGIMGRLPTNLGDPGKAWEPVNTGAAVPGAVGFWATFALVAVVGALVGLLVWAFVHPTTSGRSGRGWASWQEVRHLVAGRRDRGRLVVGKVRDSRIALPDRHSLLVLGPAHSGKSSGLVVPAILEWEGPVVVAATKSHVIDQTIGWRSRQGEVHVYDPAGVTPYFPSGWSILADCATWQGAIRTAADLTLAARGAGISEGADREIAEGQGDLWRSAMAMALAPYLLAAVSSGRPVGVASEWIEREERDEVQRILEGVDHRAARAHAATFVRPDPSRAAFLHAMHNLLSIYDDPVVASSTDRHDIVASELLDGGPNTLYLTTPEHDQARFRPLCSMILRRMIATAYEKSARSGMALSTGLLVVLDDVLGIAPIYDLASLASTAPARGVQLLSVFQDVEQITNRYGDQAVHVIRNHGAKLVIAGRPGGRPSPQDLLPAELGDQLGPDEAALVYGPARPARLSLRPWFRDRELKRRAQTPLDSVAAASPPLATSVGTPSTSADVAAWMRRPRSRSAGPRDPGIPLDTASRTYVDVFGSTEEVTLPHNVTPLPRSDRDKER